MAAAGRRCSPSRSSSGWPGVLVEQHGIRSIRLTGGEPTVRAHLPGARGASWPPCRSTSPSPPTAPPSRPSRAGLADAGLRRVNVSLDSLQPERFAELTRRDQLDDVLAGIDAALEAGLAPVKVNVVVVRGVNDDEVVDLARYGRDRGVTVRFIEWMPLDGGDAWTNDQVVTQAEIVEQIARGVPARAGRSGAASRPSGSATSTARGEVGVIPSVTRPFCEQCDRIRLTADGQLRSCLFSLEDHDLRGDRCAPAAPTTSCPTPSRPAWAPSGPATPSARCSSCSPGRSMSQIGG